MPVTLALDFEQEIDRLYGLPLDQFVKGRNELARRAREQGERAVSARIKELRKPSVSAWVINRLARERELDVQRLLEAGENLTAAQRATVEGHDPKRFLDARRDEQRALAQLTKAARALLEQGGHGASALEPITRTLRAAAITEEGRDLLKGGRLTEDLEPSGFDALAGADLRPGKRRTSPASRSSAAVERRELTEVRRRLNELERESARVERTALAAEREADAAEAEAAKLRDAARAARTDAATSSAAVAEAKRRLHELEAKGS